MSINRSQVYYKPAPEKLRNIVMMNIMDRHLTKHPTEGVKSMVYLLTAMGFIAGPKRIRRLFRLMGRHTIYRRKNLTKSGLREFIKPCLLKGIKNYACQSGLVYGYHVHTHEAGFYVLDGDNRRIQPQDRRVGYR